MHSQNRIVFSNISKMFLPSNAEWILPQPSLLRMFTSHRSLISSWRPGNDFCIATCIFCKTLQYMLYVLCEYYNFSFSDRFPWNLQLLLRHRWTFQQIHLIILKFTKYYKNYVYLKTFSAFIFPLYANTQNHEFSVNYILIASQQSVRFQFLRKLLQNQKFDS